MARAPYYQRYPKIKRAKRIAMPILIGAVIVCFIAAYNLGGLWWPALLVVTVGALWASSPTAPPLKHDDEATFSKREKD